LCEFVQKCENLISENKVTKR